MTTEHKQRIISTTLVTIGGLLGFEAVSYIFGIYQLQKGLWLSIYIYAFHIFWLSFIFDLHFKKRGVLATMRMNHQGIRLLFHALKDRFSYMTSWFHFRHYQNYLVLPGLIYWSTIVLLFLNPFKQGLKQTIILSATGVLAVAYWYMKMHISRKLEIEHSTIKILSAAKLFASFLVYSALVGSTLYFNFGSDFLIMATLSMTFLLMYQALFQHGYLNFNIFIWVVAISLTQALIALWIYKNWNAEYFTAGLVMSASYNTFWGILHHHLDRTLSRRVVVEYVIMMILIISFLFASHNFNQRVL